jgi:hypothetical protein
MTSTIGWLSHDSTEKSRFLRVLALFHEKETRDELGLGSVRDSFADTLFPGVSTIQTRLRYMMFIPWVYRSLEDEAIPAKRFAKLADKTERELVTPLMDSDDRAGVYGKMAGDKIKRLPSSVYWAGLRAWGIFGLPCSRDEYHRSVDEIYRERNYLKSLKKSARLRGDDFEGFGLNSGESAAVTWHPRLPKPPHDFPEGASFSLTREEADFLLDRIQDSCHDSLLSFLSMRGEPNDAEAPWDHPDYPIFSKTHRELLTHARLFSEVMRGAAILYNHELAKLADRKELIEEHAATFEEWRRGIPMGEIKEWSLKRFWELSKNPGHRITPFTKKFTENWINLTRNSSKNLLCDSEAILLIKGRETLLKRGRSRFKNPKALEQWKGRSGLGRYLYRWPNVKVFLSDLTLGLLKGK